MAEVQLKQFWKTIKPLSPLKQGDLVNIHSIEVQADNNGFGGQHWTYTGCTTYIKYSKLTDNTVQGLSFRGKLTEYFTLANEKAIEVLYGDKTKV